MTRILIVIPARGGSTRIPRKNMQVVGDQTLVERAYLQASNVDLCPHDCVALVSTDDAATALRMVNEYGHHSVRARISTCGDGPMAPVLLEATHEPWSRYVYDAVMCLQPTSPLRQIADIEAAWRAFTRVVGTRSLVSVDESTGKRNGAIYITRVEMLRDGLVFDDDSLKYPMPHERSLDINTPEDLEEARRILGP